MARRRYERDLPGPLGWLNDAANWSGRNLLGWVPGMDRALEPDASLLEQYTPAAWGALIGGTAAASAPALAARSAAGGIGGLESLLGARAGVGRIAAGAGRAAVRHPYKTGLGVGLGALAGPHVLQGFRGSDAPPEVEQGLPAPGGDVGPLADPQLAGLVELAQYQPPEDVFPEEEQSLNSLLGAIEKGLPGRQAYYMADRLGEERQSRERAQRKQIGTFADLLIDRARQGATAEQVLPELSVLGQVEGFNTSSPEIRDIIGQLYPGGTGSSLIARQAGGTPASLSLEPDSIRNLEADVRELRKQGLSNAAIEAALAPGLESDIGGGFYRENASWLRNLINDTL